ncbi:conserved exported hypothetical protein [Candidatus Accumulibacter aalborgensis]|uniref:Uncharacterized protein n=1 Tax=Candidatus Accumulibacter aalborgensis TaxID=1860102 RepID=A0A1A8XW46_9PROT|nr:hypothetical protein [Candidatus Accumulibacter aalborgensis]SBT09239.1 conserved exported hypothetical protein [Candidatus Accumulibacter aalborgensis]
MRRSIHSCSLVVGSLLVGMSGVADAQALFLARRAVGRIEQMAQSAPSTGASYDTATVIVEVAPDKVFETIKRLLAQNTEVRVTRSNDARRSIEFTDGTQIGGIQVNPLNDNLAQLMVSTAHPGIATSTTSIIVTRILNVCRELNVVCQLPDS